jgi:putative membrane protein
MLGIFFTTLATALSLLVVDIIFPGVDISNFPAALVAALAIGLVNASVRPVLYLLSLPLNILSLGLFSFVLNGICFWLAAVVVPGFSVQGLLSFILGPVLLSSANTFISKYFAENNPEIEAG